MRIKLIIGILFITLMCGLSSCGQRGPLYLPADETKNQQPADESI